MQSSHRSVVRLAAARDLDFLARFFQNFQVENLMQKELKRTGNILFKAVGLKTRSGPNIEANSPTTAGSRNRPS